MRVPVLKSKIHRAAVTESNLAYMGSLTVDLNLMNSVGLFPYEKVQVVNINSGARFETYLIEGVPGSGEICLNGACARLGEISDRIIIMSYADIPLEKLATHTPISVVVNEKNEILERSSEIKRAVPFEILS